MTHGHHRPGPPALWVARGLFQMEATVLPEIYEWFSRLDVVFVIVNGKKDDMQQHQRGVPLESTQGRAMYSPNNGGFEWRAGEYIGDEALHKQIEEPTKGLDEVFAENRARKLEIRSCLYR